MEIIFYPYKLERRTEYSKIKVTNIKIGEDMSNYSKIFPEKNNY